MGVHYDWNIVVIAQFYATLFIEETEGVRRMHWMTERDWYNIGYDDFASHFFFGAGTLTALGFITIIHLMMIR
jgi:hypothetical protein